MPEPSTPERVVRSCRRFPNVGYDSVPLPYRMLEFEDLANEQTVTYFMSHLMATTIWTQTRYLWDCNAVY